MNAHVYLQKDEKIEYLERQIGECVPVNKLLDRVGKEYLVYREIYDVLDINDKIINDYVNYLNQKKIKSDKLVKSYQGNLLKWKNHHKRKNFKDLIEEVESCEDIRPTLRNKAITFLSDCNIHGLKEINCETRIAYEHYLIKNEYKEVDSYVKALDKLKLYYLKKIENKPHKLKSKIKFEEKMYFLGYYPNYKIANSFFAARKESLIWDFTIKTESIMKYQIFSMLIYTVEEIGDIVTRMKFYILPLKHLYNYCIETGICDLTLLEQEDIDKYDKSLQGEGLTDKKYKQIINKVQKFLFIKGESTNWNANVWYLERFHFSNTRMNPSSPVDKISFLDMYCGRNRDLLKIYIKYKLGVSNCAIKGIYSDNYQIKRFLRYLDEKGIIVEDVDTDAMNQYLRWVEKEGENAATFNKKLKIVYQFFSFLKIQGYIDNIPFLPEYYLKAEMQQHHNRTVPEDTVEKILQHLDQFPEDVRLMFLHLWSLGLRLNEVCSIEVKNYYHKDGVKWLRIYQHKMKAEKIIPIPDILYKATQIYIKRNKRTLEDYVFQNRKGGAFNACSFWHTMVDLCNKYGIQCGNYVFKSHDYRHSIATKLFDQGVSLQVIRDFLGHKFEDMTKEYIDFIPKKIEKKTLEYYEQNESLVSKWKNGKC